jgi:hypothetical protein
MSESHASLLGIVGYWFPAFRRIVVPSFSVPISQDYLDVKGVPLCMNLSCNSKIRTDYSLKQCCPNFFPCGPLLANQITMDPHILAHVNIVSG